MYISSRSRPEPTVGRASWPQVHRGHLGDVRRGCIRWLRCVQLVPLLSGALALALALVCVACTPAPAHHATTPRATPTPVQHSLAHDGGLRLVLRASCPASVPGCDLGVTLPAALAILRLRATDALGVAGALVQSQGASDVLVELPTDRDASHAVAALTTPGHVAFLDTTHTALPLGANLAARTCTAHCAPGQYAVVFTGEQVDPASVSAHVDTVTGRGYVVLAFAGDTQTDFTVYTHRHLGQYLTVTRDGIAIESAQINDIVPGPTEITGLPTEQDARLLATYLKDGPLPLTLSVLDSAVVSPAP